MRNSQYHDKARYKNGFAPVVITIIIGVIILGSAAYWGAHQSVKIKNQNVETVAPAATPRPSTTSAEIKVDATGWKTYRNEKYGFEFRYPSAIKLLVEMEYETLDDASWLHLQKIGRKPGDGKMDIRIINTKENYVNFANKIWKQNQNQTLDKPSEVKIWSNKGVSFRIAGEIIMEDMYRELTQKYLFTFMNTKNDQVLVMWLPEEDNTFQTIASTLKLE